MANMPNGSQIRRGGGSLMHYVGWIMIFGFTATCTILLLRQYAPPDVPWLPWAGLAAFEFGCIHWLHYHKHNAKNALQFLIGLSMTVISVLAIASATAIEMISWFSRSGTIALPSWIAGVIFYAIIGTIVANVLAFVLCSLFDPSHFTTWLQHSGTAYHLDARDRPISVVEAAPPREALAAPKEATRETDEIPFVARVQLNQNGTTTRKTHD